MARFNNSRRTDINIAKSKQKEKTKLQNEEVVY